MAGGGSPGNVRELEHAIRRAIVRAPGGVIPPECIPVQERPVMGAASWVSHLPQGESYWAVNRQVEERLLRNAREGANGNKAEAARILGFQRRLL